MLAAFQELPLKNPGACSSTPLQINPVGQKVGLAEQGIPLGAAAGKEIT